MLAGGPVKRGYALRGASVVDVAPNVLYLLGIPVADDMAGKVWRDAYEPSFVRRFPPRRVRSYRGLRVVREGAPDPRRLREINVIPESAGKSK
ncbi:MAG TPA: hypothetical protein VMW93_04130 [bacterium]|nr:hypothetical protein [bacterium]